MLPSASAARQEYADGPSCKVRACGQVLALSELRATGSRAAVGFMKPEGVVCFHVAANVGFKTTIEKDDEYKSK